LQKLELSADPRIIRHDIKELNLKLMEAQYFYSDVAKEGIIIFDTGKSELAERKKLSDEERNKIAKKYFDVWFKSAEEFFKYYNIAVKEGDLLKAVFFLHQATEASYKTLLLVFTNYNPSEHFLKNLHAECLQYFPELRELFVINNEQDKQRFELFDYAYIGARYDINYKISKEDLEILAADVSKLLELTEKLCSEKLVI
jgi:HEPN domain-containing protein